MMEGTGAASAVLSDWKCPPTYLKAGDRVLNVAAADQGWSEGTLKGERVRFPSAILATNEALLARAQNGSAGCQDVFVLHELGRRYESGASILEKNPKIAAEYYTKAAELGYPDSQRQLGLCYENGVGVEKAYERAVSLYRQAAEKRNASANACLAKCYEKGIGLTVNLEEAFKLFKQAAEQGDAHSMYCLAEYYLNHNNVPAPDTEDAKKAANKLAREWLQKAADLNEPNALFKLADDLAELRQLEQALPLWRKAAEFGLGKACLRMASAYEYGNPVQKDDEEAFHWYEKGAALNHVGAIFHLGQCYKLGLGVERNDAKVIELWTRASNDHNDAFSMAALGLWYVTHASEEYRSVPLAIQWLQKAIAIDPETSNAYKWLGDIYYEEGEEEDLPKVLEMYIEGTKHGSIEAMLAAGECFEKGTGVEPNPVKAAEYNKMAAEAGSASGMHRYGVWLTTKPDSTEEDVRQAFIMWATAAQEEHIESMWEMSRFYMMKLKEGKIKRLCAHEAKLTFMWTQVLSLMGDKPAMEVIVNLIMLGIGCKADTGLANNWRHIISTRANPKRFAATLFREPIAAPWPAFDHLGETSPSPVPLPLSLNLDGGQAPPPFVFNTDAFTSIATASNSSSTSVPSLVGAYPTAASASSSSAPASSPSTPAFNFSLQPSASAAFSFTNFSLPPPSQSATPPASSVTLQPASPSASQLAQPTFSFAAHAPSQPPFSFSSQAASAAPFSFSSANSSTASVALVASPAAKPAAQAPPSCPTQ